MALSHRAQQLLPSLCIFTQANGDASGDRSPKSNDKIVEPPSSDQELISGLQSGSNEAFAALFKQYADGIYAYCVKILADRQRAKDVVQETFLKIRQFSGQIQHGESFKYWIFRIAHNEALMEIRKQRRNGHIEVDSVWQEETPHDQYINLERTAVVNGLLDSLRREYREVLILRAYEDLSYSEIAAITGDSESSVKSRIFKARKAMSKKLKEYYQ